MPISFTCPHCGKQTLVAERFAGQTGPCAACGGTVTIPRVESSPQAPTGTTSSGGSGVAGVLAVVLGMALAGLLLCGGIGYFLVMPALKQAQATTRQAAQRTQSSNNLRQLGLALHMYHDTYKSFPPAVVTDANGTPLYSGRVLLLPFLEHDHVYRRFDRTKAWDSPENQAIVNLPVTTFLDPAYKGPNVAGSNYVFVTGPNRIFDGNQTTSMANITDGTSNTLLMIETAAGPTHWAAPDDWDATTGQLPAGNHNAVVLVLFADGSVRAVVPQAVSGILNRLTIRNDGQVIPQF